MNTPIRTRGVTHDILKAETPEALSALFNAWLTARQGEQRVVQVEHLVVIDPMDGAQTWVAMILNTTQ